MNPTSPQMSAALKAMREWACDFYRDEAQQEFRPLYYSTTPPRITARTMDSLIRRGLVTVISRTGRGAPYCVALSA